MTGDLRGRVAVVTGGDMGIGRATATQLASRGAAVVITVRPPADGDAAAAAIRAASGNEQVSAVDLELGDLDAVSAAADELLGRLDRIDVLVNNAGGFLTVRKETAQGHEVSLGVNYLGPFLLTQRLLDRLRSSAPARVVNLSSSQHKAAGAFDFHDLEMREAFNGVQAYNRSKLAMLLFAKELARREATSGVAAFAVQPGAVRSNFGRHGETTGVWNLALKLLRPTMISPEKGAGASVHCATEPGLEAQSGGYFQRGLQGNVGRVREVQPSEHANDLEAAARLWDWSMDAVGPWLGR